MAVLAVVGLLGFGVIAKGERQLEVGEPVPVRTLPTLAPETSAGAGDSASLADFRGRWVLVNIWASWCGPCEDEAPDLVAFQERHGGPGFTILGIDTQDGTDDALDFEREFGLNYPSVRDGSGEYADELGATGVPESILVDPDGNAAHIVPGQITPEILEEQIAPLIRDDAAPATGGADESP